MDDQRAGLVLDEDLFLHAMRTLAAQDGPHELLTVVEEYAATPYLASRFAVEAQGELGESEREAICLYVAAIYLTEQHRASLEDIGSMKDQFADDALAFIRAAAWAYLNAWTMRYGGLWASRVVRGTLVDPSV